MATVVNTLKRLLMCSIWCSLLSLEVHAGLDINVKGLLKNSAIVEVNGKQRLLKIGKTSPEGITLISANSKKAVIEVHGKRRTLTLSKNIGVHYSQPQFQEVRIASGRGGHYFPSGKINNRNVTFLVDTGATSVAMSETEAKSLGLKYSHGQVGQASTAGGMVKSWNITLQSVSVGGITLYNVGASVVEGNFPNKILLGNTFLRRLNLSKDNGVLVLTTQHSS